MHFGRDTEDTGLHGGFQDISYQICNQLQEQQRFWEG
jgi:hypothetical protein